MPRFRFHTGSIKSATRVENQTLSPEEFRFHTGSIKSQMGKRCNLDGTGFDSILVRLKDETGLQVCRSTSGRFDSILVRLKVDRPIAETAL